MSVAVDVDTQRRIPALPTLAPGDLVPGWSNGRPLPFPFSEPSSRYRSYYLGRTAIVQGIRALALPSGSVALMPAYHHGIEVEAVRAAGLDVRFYRVDTHLQLDVGDLCSRLDESVRLIYVTHFAGFPAPIEEARAIADRRGIALVEDCALALLSRATDGTALGKAGDLAIFCLYKTLPVPHGGGLLTRRMPPDGAPAPPALATAAHLAGSLLRHAELRGGGIGRAVRHGLRRAFRFVRPETRRPVGRQHLSAHEMALGASLVLKPILSNLPYDAIVARRRRNYARLFEQVREVAKVPTGPLPPGTCPLFLPVWVGDRDHTLSRLWKAGIEAIDLWREGFERPDHFPDVAALRRHVIELPCHQDLDDHEIDFIARTLRESI